MTMSIKIVPEVTPDADGEWITVEAVLPRGGDRLSWRATEIFLSPYIPDGYVLVAVGDRVTP